MTPDDIVLWSLVDRGRSRMVFAGADQPGNHRRVASIVTKGPKVVNQVPHDYTVSSFIDGVLSVFRVRFQNYTRVVIQYTQKKKTINLAIIGYTHFFPYQNVSV